MKRATLFFTALTVCMVAEMTRADFVFGEPVNLGPPVNSAYSETCPSISADGLQLYFHDWPLYRPGGYGSHDIWVATRATKDDSWGEPVNLGSPVNTSSWDFRTSVSADDLTLYFTSDRPGGYGSHDIWVATRATKDDPWGEPVNLGSPVNTSVRDRGPSISADGLELYFYSNRLGGQGTSEDIWVTMRETTADDWGTPVNLGPTVNSLSHDYSPDISADGLRLFFASERPGGYGGSDIWVTTRASVSDSWGPPMNLGPTVNSMSSEADSAISPDGYTLFISSDRRPRLGSSDIWQVPVVPVVDLNSDGIVDAADMSIIVDNWGTDEPLCDIGPMPWGDGIVDVEDLIVVAEHLFEDDRLIAHWELDEEVGDIAHDSAGQYDAIVHSQPAWQPTGGRVRGALKFDGMDDYVVAPFVLNPGEGPFSVTAWIKGGAPGQVIISQADVPGDETVKAGSTWLGTDSSSGRLVSGLMEIYFGPLESESVITDGQWHHVGLVYDRSVMKRRLYVDGVEVAVDAGYVVGVQTTGSLHFGAARDLNEAAFFSGLIDDVRIYNRAVSP